MQLPQIKIESQQAQIGIQTSQSFLQIEQPQAEMQIRQPQPKLKINKTPSKLTIDQTEAWAAMDIKPILQRIREEAAKGKQSWLQYIGETAQQGDQMMKVENGGNSIPRLAKVNSENGPIETNIGWVPPAFSVKFNYQPSKLHINFETSQALIDVKPNQPKFHYIPTDINIYLKQKNALKIDFVGTNLDTRK